MNEAIEEVYNFLSEEGFRPEFDDKENIDFKYEGDQYFIYFDDEIEDFISVGRIMDIDFKDKDPLKTLTLVNKINNFVVGKCLLLDESDNIFMFKVDFLGEIENFKDNFERYLRIIQIMIAGFVGNFEK